MLVLTRRPGESIIIAGDIKLTVVSVGPGRVKIGIEAPSHVRVDRQEIHDKIEQSSDVLATVGQAVNNGTHNTMVNTGGDTAMIVSGGAPVENAPHAVAVPKPEVPVAASVPPAGKLSKYRKPRV
ncbi:carbon storage regulator [Gemmata sp. JC717]|uniref:Translational regulator CsrA n=1 Tax=Gemmata algarum TaxID=2975278 RepID=A0ABU5F287_9BACT|nr:carbon storage regulator [Gemmata algarum]MDY3553948.1 carbon storage regulator [Gemmata algarum]MDY3561697.1 carbon storage regulator [Gemmata algarum]